MHPSSPENGFSCFQSMHDLEECLLQENYVFMSGTAKYLQINLFLSSGKRATK